MPLLFSVEEIVNAEGRSFFSAKKDHASKGAVTVVVDDHEREQSSENIRPIIVKQRPSVYRPFPVVQPIFIEHPVNHKRRPQYESEEWSRESSEEVKIPKRPKPKMKNNHNYIREQIDEEHHFHYLPILPKYHPINYPNCTDLHPNNVTLVSRVEETLIEVTKIIQSIIEQVQSA